MNPREKYVQGHTLAAWSLAKSVCSSGKGRSDIIIQSMQTNKSLFTISWTRAAILSLVSPKCLVK
jgi:hypothetical protein